MFSRSRRAYGRVALIVSVIAAGVLVSASPASAHTLNQAVRAPAGCAWLSGGYSQLDSDAVETSSGTRYGTVYLLWSNTYRQNCVVTRKTGSLHGTSTWTDATLYRQDGGSSWNRSNFSHYAAASAATGGVCVKYRGIIRSGQGSSGGTKAEGGRST
ncbi:hypothetical protein LP52_04970 [Streptomonospora alba]|uniref:Uncharacterized protein n=1 Tax=Streptomonospora alba TaxID=183763 RepID=A0A0C2JLM7_9ACTN|nr:hypothetical protein [Streptomonospora alba]KIH99855.1 hypothetical protein LP52_04970 [Streptomonospora alba]